MEGAFHLLWNLSISRGDISSIVESVNKRKWHFIYCGICQQEEVAFHPLWNLSIKVEVTFNLLWNLSTSGGDISSIVESVNKRKWHFIYCRVCQQDDVAFHLLWNLSTMEVTFHLLLNLSTRGRSTINNAPVIPMIPNR